MHSSPGETQPINHSRHRQVQCQTARPRQSVDRSRRARSPTWRGIGASLGKTSLGHPILLARPAFRQEQPQANGNRNLLPRQRQRHPRLAIGSLAQNRRILWRDPNRMVALLRRIGIVNRQERIRSAVLSAWIANSASGGAASQMPSEMEMMETVVVNGCKALCHRLNALAFSRPNQARI